MDFHKHPPMLTPLISAAALMLMGGFLLHRMHPGGIMAALRGERPNPQRTVTIVPSVVSAPDPVAWGEVGVVQIGLEAPPRHGEEGPVWMALHLRHGAAGPVSLAAGMKGVQGSGRMSVKVRTDAGQTIEWPIPEAMLAFSLHIPKDDDVRLPFRYQEPFVRSPTRQTNSFTVSLLVQDVAIRTEQGTVGPVQLETGGIVLTRCWSPDGAGRQKGSAAGDDGLGIRPGDIVIPVPGQR